MNSFEFPMTATPSASPAAPAAGFLPATGVFATGLLATWLLPLSHFLMYPYERLSARDGALQWHHVLSHAQALGMTLLQWGIAAVAFGALAKRERRVMLIPLMLVAFTVITLAMHAIVAWLGLGFYRDLWH